MEPELNRQKSPDAGLTLIELLVVISILAVFAVGTSFSVSGRAGDRAIADREWFTAQFSAQRAIAITGRKTRGLSVTPKGLSFARLTPEGWQITPPARRWRGAVSLSQLAPRPVVGRPDVLLFANGRASGFEIQFTPRRGPAQRCRSDGWSDLLCDTP